MVYHGKPSSGCGRCKQRRKKCDETRPKCLNCQRIGHECPGYPDKLDIMFKNETAVVVRRATKRSRHTVESPTSTRSRSGSSVLTPSLEWVTNGLPDSESTVDKNEEGVVNRTTNGFAGGCPSEQEQPRRDRRSVDELDRLVCPDGCCLTPLSMTFNPGIEEQVTQFFFGHFRHQSIRSVLARGLVDVLVPRIGSLPARSPLLMASQAIAMRTVGLCQRREEFTPRANALYCRAMASIQMWIEDSILCMQDDTLLAVLLFSMYESIAATSVKNWSDHVHGALNIIKARGVMNYHDPLPLLLFRATRGNVLTDALRRCEPMPGLPDTRTWLESEPNMTSSHTLQRFVRLSHLRFEAKELLSSMANQNNTRDANDVIERVFQLQGEFAQSQDCVQTDCACVTIVHWANTFEDDLAGTMTGIVRSPTHVEGKMHEVAVRRHNQIGQLLSARIIASIVEWLKPHAFHADERHQVAGLWIQYMSDVVRTSRPRYLDFVTRPAARSEEKGVEDVSETLTLLQAAHGLCTPPFHWALTMADLAPRRTSISDLGRLTIGT